MFCCFGTSKKQGPQGNPTEMRREKVYLSLSPQLTFQLDESFSWKFTGQTNPDQKDSKQSEEQTKALRMSISKLEQEIKLKQQEYQKFQRLKMEKVKQYNQKDEQNLKKKAYVWALEYINLKESQAIEEYYKMKL